MIRNIFALAACLGMTACTSIGSRVDEWSAVDTRRELAFQLINAIDAVQTSEIRHRAEVVEVGPVARAVMGPEPSASDVGLYFGTMAASHFLISRALPPGWRKYWQAGTIASHGYTVVRNCTKFDLGC